MIKNRGKEIKVRITPPYGNQRLRLKKELGSISSMFVDMV